jgi:hypothetical protein
MKGIRIRVLKHTSKTKSFSLIWTEKTLISFPKKEVANFSSSLNQFKTIVNFFFNTTVFKYFYSFLHDLIE